MWHVTVLLENIEKKVRNWKAISVWTRIFLELRNFLSCFFIQQKARLIRNLLTPHLLKLGVHNILKITNEYVYTDFPLCFPCIFEEPSKGYNFSIISCIGPIFWQKLIARLSFLLLNKKIKTFWKVKKKFFWGTRFFVQKFLTQNLTKV